MCCDKLCRSHQTATEDVLFGYNLFGGAITSHAQPARKQTPPSGVIAPNERTFVSAIVYKLPLNKIIPATKSQNTPRFAAAKNASTNKAIAWMK
ncbi:MAG: hypothetical protein QOI04_873 [Verrucomicrobiota bacterium]